MFVALAIVFPALLLLAILGMERVERPLEKSQVRKNDRRGDDRPGTPRRGQANTATPLAVRQTEGGTHVAGA